MKIKPGFSFFLGLRNFYSFRKGKRRTMAGAVIAVALSIIPLIVVLEVSDGMIEGITRRFIELETGHLQVSSYEEMSVSEMEKVSRELEELPEIIYASPVYRGMGLIYSENYKSGIQVKALPPDIYEKDSGFRNYLEITGGEFDLSGGENIMLSSELARQLGVKAGQQIKLLTGKTAKNGKMILRPEMYEISGIFSTGYYEVDSMTAYINLEKGEKLFRGEGRLHIQCKIIDPYDSADQTALMIRDKYESFSTVTWFRMQKSMYESLYTTRILLLFIMAIIVIVAAVNIASSLLIMVVERRQDIAILKSCGTSNIHIRRAFIYTGMFTGIIGAVAGITIGLLISMNINGIIQFIRNTVSFISGSPAVLSASEYYLEQIPVKVKIPEILIVAVTTVLLSTAAALHPARKAEKMSPKEIMQKH
ncbi:MAG: ABC transporter permease [Spirochaetales bacterium]|nr:ABC transporter permease [Spirochaetales bacterium]